MAKIDNKEYEVEIIVSGSREKNKFWMHKILLEAKKEESGLSLRDDQERSHTEVNKTRIPYDNVSQSAENVKRENENLTTIRNLNEDDLAAMYGSARIPVQELLANTEGAGDVSLIVKNEDTRNNNAHLENMAAVIPSSVDWWLVERLKMNGLNVVEYRAGNEQARQEADAEKLLEPKKRFSLSPEEKVQRAERKMTAAQEKLEKEKTAAQERYRRELESSVRKLFNIQSYDKENLDNALEKLFDVPEEREEFDGWEAVRDTGYNLMNEIPFASNLSGLMGWGDRSLPMPNIADGLINLQKAISQDGAISQNAGEIRSEGAGKRR